MNFSLLRNELLTSAIEQAKTLVGTVGPRSEEERLNEVRELATRASVAPADATRKVGYWEIVNGVNESAGAQFEGGAVRSEIVAVASHTAIFWTTINAAERVELPDAPPGMGSFRLSANLKNLM